MQHCETMVWWAYKYFNTSQASAYFSVFTTFLCRFPHTSLYVSHVTAAGKTQKLPAQHQKYRPCRLLQELLIIVQHLGLSEIINRASVHWIYKSQESSWKLKPHSHRISITLGPLVSFIVEDICNHNVEWTGHVCNWQSKDSTSNVLPYLGKLRSCGNFSPALINYSNFDWITFFFKVLFLGYLFSAS